MRTRGVLVTPRACGWCPRAPSTRTRRELKEELRKRLRVEAIIWAFATGVIALTATLVQRDQLRIDASRFWTAPPLPGVLFVICVTTIGVAWLLSPVAQAV